MNVDDAAGTSSESERKFSILFDKAGFAAALSKLPNGILVDVNEAWVNTFGYTRQEAVGKTTLDLQINPDAEGRARILAQLQENGFAHDIETMLQTKSGEWRIFLTNLDIVEIGEEKYILNSAQDITERKRAEQQLERNNKKLHEILESIQDDFYVLDRDWKFVYANRLFTSKVGKEPEDFIGKNIWEMFPKHVGTVFEENLRAAMENREVRRFEIHGKYTLAWYRMRAFPSEEGITLLGTDITERKRIEEQLRYQATLLSNVNDAIVASDTEYRITAWNAGAEALYGWKAEEVLGCYGPDIVGTEWSEKDANEMRRIIAEIGHWRGEATQQRKDGSRFPVEMSSIVLYDENRNVTGFVSVNRDITERKRVEDALHANEKQLQILNESLEQKVREKTAEIRRLASDISRAEQRERHRISHILHDDLQQRVYVIQMKLTFLKDDLKGGSGSTQKALADIEQQVDEVLMITRHLSIDLSPPILHDEGLSQAIDWLAAQMRERYNLSIELQADGPFIIRDEELHVLLFNCIRELLFNIVKHAQVSRAVVALQWSEEGLHIEVSDDGKGITSEAVDQQGGDEDDIKVNFGLATIQHQLSLFGGRMEIRSEAGKGTRVFLSVPTPKADKK